MNSYIDNNNKHFRECYTHNDKQSIRDRAYYAFSIGSMSGLHNISHYALYTVFPTAATENWIVFTKEKAISKTEQEFRELSKKWKEETGIFSTTYQKVMNDSYLEIIGLGKEAIPYILKELQKGSMHWHTALKAITKENPVDDGDLNKSNKVREAWINWGKSKKII